MARNIRGTLAQRAFGHVVDYNGGCFAGTPFAGDTYAGMPCWCSDLSSIKSNVCGEVVTRRPVIMVDGVMKLHARVVKELVHGPPPPGRPQLRHLCHNAMCVNPWHTVWGTQKENMQDKVAAGTAYGRSGPKGFMPFLRDNLEQLINKGWSLTCIATVLGMCRTSLSDTAKKLGILTPKARGTPRRKGQPCPKTLEEDFAEWWQREQPLLAFPTL